MTTDPIAAAIDHIRSITPADDPWTAYDNMSSFSLGEPGEADYAIATILNAVVSGRLILTDALEAERTRAEKAEAERDTAWNDAIEAAKGCVDDNHPFSIMDEMDLLKKGDSHNQQAERDQALARVAAAYEAAITVAKEETNNWKPHDLAEVCGFQCGYAIALRIRTLTTADAQAALDKMLAEARLEGWRAGRDAAYDACREWMRNDDSRRVEDVILALPEPKEASHDPAL